MLYNAGDTVLYGSRGVCRITEIEEKDMVGKRMKYYVLKPVFDDKATIFVPISSDTLCAKMRQTMSTKEIYGLIKSMSKIKTIWNEDENLRRKEFKQILSDGDSKALVLMLKALNLHQEEKIKSGKKLHSADEKLMKDAQKMLHEEFAYVMDIKVEEVLPFIFRQMETNEKDCFA